MITEDYVSFETAKLLKEKGFDEYGMYFYTLEDEGEEGYKSNKRLQEFAHNSHPELEKRAVSCPTLQMAMKWLRDVHDLIISVSFTVHGWLCDITKVFRDSNGFIVNINHGIGDDSLPYCDEHEEACEAAIKYCLENLI